jgi:hypothetical protein
VTQRRQRHTGEFTGLTVQVGLVGVPGAAGHLNERHSIAQ